MANAVENIFSDYYHLSLASRSKYVRKKSKTYAAMTECESWSTRAKYNNKPQNEI